MNATRHGVFPDRVDLRLCALMLVLSVVDFSQISWWAGSVKPLGELQRWTDGRDAGRLRRRQRLADQAGARAACPAACADRLLRRLCALVPEPRDQPSRRRPAPPARGQHPHRSGAPRRDAVARIFLLTCGTILMANLLARAAPGTLDHDRHAGGRVPRPDRPQEHPRPVLRPHPRLRAGRPLRGARPPPDLRASAAFSPRWSSPSPSPSRLPHWCSAPPPRRCFSLVGLAQRTGLPLLVGILGVGLLAAVAAAFLAGALNPFEALGRDTTLTGRAEIWAFVETLRAAATLARLRLPRLPAGRPAPDRSALGPRQLHRRQHPQRLSRHRHRDRFRRPRRLYRLARALRDTLTSRAMAGRTSFARPWSSASTSSPDLSESFAGLSPGLYFAALLVAFPRVPEPDAAWLSPHQRGLKTEVRIGT